MSDKETSKEPEKGRTQDRKSKKPEPAADTEFDVFIRNSVFEHPEAVFALPPSLIGESKGEACVFLDTSALLVPYSTSSETLASIEKTYRKLIKDNRLIIPGQVAREFAANRFTKIGELFERMHKRQSALQQFRQGQLPLLAKCKEYRELQDLEAQIDTLIEKYRNVLGKVIDHIRSWEWNDPVSTLYSELFVGSVFAEPSQSKEMLRDEHARRYLHKIPPGYQDEGSKDDRGIGDLLIWFTILEVARRRGTSAIFVTGEEKSDWWHRSQKQPLYPRFELAYEYRQASGGRSFHIIKFSQLLELFGAESAIVEEVRQEEFEARALSDLDREVAALRIAMERGEIQRQEARIQVMAVAHWFVDHGNSVSGERDPLFLTVYKDGISKRIFCRIVTDYTGVERAATDIIRHRPLHVDTVVVVVKTRDLARDFVEAFRDLSDKTTGRCAVAYINPDGVVESLSYIND